MIEYKLLDDNFLNNIHQILTIINKSPYKKFNFFILTSSIFVRNYFKNIIFLVWDKLLPEKLYKYIPDVRSEASK